jgi:hypothetical protein
MRGAASADHPQTAVQLAVLVFLVATLPHATQGLPLTQLTGSEESNVIAIAIQADVSLLSTPSRHKASRMPVRHLPRRSQASFLV